MTQPVIAAASVTTTLPMSDLQHGHCMPSIVIALRLNRLRVQVRCLHYTENIGRAGVGSVGRMGYSLEARSAGGRRVTLV